MLRRSPDDGTELQDVQQQDERSVSAQVPVDEGEGELHEHGGREREEQREPLPDLVSGGAVRGAEVQRSRGLSREQRHRHQDGAGEAHPHSRRHLRGKRLRGWGLVHHGATETVCQGESEPLTGTGTELQPGWAGEAGRMALLGGCRTEDSLQGAHCRQ